MICNELFIRIILRCRVGRTSLLCAYRWNQMRSVSTIMRSYCWQCNGLPWIDFLMGGQSVCHKINTQKEAVTCYYTWSMNLLRKNEHTKRPTTKTTFEYMWNWILQGGIQFLNSTEAAWPRPYAELRSGDQRGHWQRSTNPKVTFLKITTFGKTAANRTRPYEELGLGELRPVLALIRFRET
jgi:hypothetical protein